LSEQRTIPTIIGKFSGDDVVQVIRLTTIFIIRTSLKNQADELLQALVETLGSEHLKLAATKLANVIVRVRKVHPELISSLLRALTSSRGPNSFFELLGVLRESPARSRNAISYDAQGVAAALYDAGLDANVLAPFVQRIRRLELTGTMYEQLTQEIVVLKCLLEDAADMQQLGRIVPSSESRQSAEQLLPLLQLGLARYRGEQLDYLAKAISVLSSDGFRPTDLALIVRHATSDLPCSLDRLAKPEDFVAEQTSRELGSALVTLWIQIELAGESKERQPTAADLSRKLRVVVDGQV
jgi:hypothetical protein